MFLVILGCRSLWSLSHVHIDTVFVLVANTNKNSAINFVLVMIKSRWFFLQISWSRDCLYKLSILLSGFDYKFPIFLYLSRAIQIDWNKKNAIYPFATEWSYRSIWWTFVWYIFRRNYYNLFKVIKRIAWLKIFGLFCWIGNWAALLSKLREGH